MGRGGLPGGTMHENDLFKIAVRNLSEEDIATNLGMPEAAVDKDSKQ